MKTKFKDIKFKPDSLARIEVCNEIIDEYTSAGLRLTLRQLYYQLVTKNIITNEEKSYKHLSSLISDARLAGLVDWSAIEDRIRQPRIQNEFTNLAELIETAVQSYRLPRWEGQEYYVELWLEKDALAGVLTPLAREFHATLMVNRGYCVAPETLILTSDFTWIPAGDLVPGTELFAPDEQVPGPKKHRKLRLTKAKSITKFIAPRVRVITDHGEIVVSRNHPFLSTMRRENRGYLWTHADRLKPGSIIAWLVTPWKQDCSWEAGWVAGMLDGEGCLPQTRLNLEMDVYQKPGLVADQLRVSLPRFAPVGLEHKDALSGVISFRFYGIENIMTVLGRTRPVRLMQNFRGLIAHRGGPGKSKTPAIVLAVEPLPDGEVIGLETGTKTLITNGFVSHNSSQSAMYESAQRFINSDRQPLLFYLGDHDPSGEDMVRDIRDRLILFGVDEIEVQKLALTMDQVHQYNPPPNPTKIDDPRSASYISEFGNSSWEVDALPPEVLNNIIREAFGGIIDSDLMDKIKRKEEMDKRKLRKITK
jgi:hypothetical protein